VAGKPDTEEKRMSSTKTAIVVTTINNPTRAMDMFRDGARDAGWRFYVVGDLKTSDAAYEGYDATYLSDSTQRASGLPYAEVIVDNHYARKNMGYLQAFLDGAECIVESDDDNLPRPGFFAPRNRRMVQALVRDGGWVNAYRYFTDAPVWPRGFPLELIKIAPPEPGIAEDAPALLQQGLADEDPDVDAIFRLVGELPITFEKRAPIGLVGRSWCPFNSQNTTWFSDLFPLMYLPSYCSFRMVDIWRAFVASAILAANDLPIAFHSANVWQERNDHNLLRDFEAEVPGYLQNAAIMAHLEASNVPAGLDRLGEALLICYEKLVVADIFPEKELDLVERWIASLP
jgi:hypothetical protein